MTKTKVMMAVGLAAVMGLNGMAIFADTNETTIQTERRAKCRIDEEALQRMLTEKGITQEEWEAMIAEKKAGHKLVEEKFQKMLTEKGITQEEWEAMRAERKGMLGERRGLGEGQGLRGCKGLKEAE